MQPHIRSALLRGLLLFGASIGLLAGTAEAAPKKSSLAGLYRGSEQERKVDAQNRAYHRHSKASLLGRYRGSEHERRLDAQIRAYSWSAKENERVFGAATRKRALLMQGVMPAPEKK